MKIDQETLDQVSDDLELKLDNFLERVHQFALREARKLKDDVRAVCVDYPHVPAEKIKELYLDHTKRMFDVSYVVEPNADEWRKEAETLS